MHLLLASVLLSTFPSHIQYLQSHRGQSLGLVYAANSLIGCLIGGIGSKFNDGTFKRGCAVGAFGGAVIAEGAVLASDTDVVPGFGALGKLTAEFGGSVIANASANIGAFDTVSADFGPLQVEYANGFSLHFTINPLLGIIENARMSRVDVRQTIYNLTPVFVSSKLLGKHGYAGYTTGNVVIYVKQVKRQAMSHEMVHVTQWSKLKAANALHLGPWNYGQDAVYYIDTSYTLLGSTAYYNSPQELEAYALMGNRQ
jgi:hypothetical protein